LRCELDELALLPGQYRVNVALEAGGELQDHVEGAGFFNVEPGVLRGRPVARAHGYGSVCLPHRWRFPRS
jgi:lipopolysaccharide transport system ATP-binding protein